MATVGVEAHNLLKRLEDAKNGNSYCKSMCEWCGRDVIKMRLCITSGQKLRSNASHHHQMQKIT